MIYRKCNSYVIFIETNNSTIELSMKDSMELHKYLNLENKEIIKQYITKYNESK